MGRQRVLALKYEHDICECLLSEHSAHVHLEGGLGYVDLDPEGVNVVEAHVTVVAAKDV